jgi:hypothetical protein
MDTENERKDDAKPTSVADPAEFCGFLLPIKSFGGVKAIGNCSPEAASGLSFTGNIADHCTLTVTET